MNLSNSSSPAVSANELPSVDALRTIYADKLVGERFEFGRYPQGANGEIMPITWRVLRREKDHLLVIAEQCLDFKSYHTEQCPIVWADCALRRWLNSEFYDQAFNEQERGCFLQTCIVNDTGPNTDDCIFLLSVDEAESSFANDIERRAKLTGYAAEKGVFNDGDGDCFWWLRSRGYYEDHAALVYTNGAVHASGLAVVRGIFAVRPAFRIAL